jgi:hypothetical protein
LKEIKKNKKTYSVEAGTTIIGKMRDTLYERTESYHHKREREIHFIREQIAAIISKREKIYHEKADNCHHE